MTNKLTPQENTLPKAIKLLLWLSFGLWVYSLFALGIDDGSQEKHYGFSILLIGTFLGWLGCLPILTGLAVYANYFYLFALYRLAFKNKMPTTSTVFMLIFASLTFFVRKILRDEAGHWSDVDAWGWGAIWWGLSLITLTIATYTQSGKIPYKKALPITAIIYAVVLLPLMALFLYQYNIANDNEKAQYFTLGIYGTIFNYDSSDTKINNNFYSAAQIFFSGGTAFVVDKNAFSRIEYNEPPSELPKNSVLQINGDIDFSKKWSLISGDLAIELPSSFVHQGKLYQRQNGRYNDSIFDSWDASFIKVTPFSGHVDYTMNLLQSNDKGVYLFTITDENKKSIFYQTNIVKKENQAYPFNYYYGYHYSLDKPNTQLDNHIVVSEKCTQKSNMDIYNLSIDNQDYIVVPSQEKKDDWIKDFSEYKLRDLYCSEQLAILLFKSRFFVFDKRNMQVVMEFKMYNNSDSKEIEKIKQYIMDNIDDENSNITFTYDYSNKQPHHGLLINTPIGEVQLNYYAKYNNDYIIND